jgi:hypothetical protein
MSSGTVGGCFFNALKSTGRSGDARAVVKDALEFTHSPLDIAGHRDGLLDATLLVLLYLRLALLLSISCGLPRGCFGCPTLGGQLSLNVR